MGRLGWFYVEEETCCHICVVHTPGEMGGRKEVAAGCDFHRLEKECRCTWQGLFWGVRLPARSKVVQSSAFLTDAEGCRRAFCSS